jgi:hypothetical protein
VSKPSLPHTYGKIFWWYPNCGIGWPPVDLSHSGFSGRPPLGVRRFIAALKCGRAARHSPSTEAGNRHGAKAAMNRRKRHCFTLDQIVGRFAVGPRLVLSRSAGAGVGGDLCGLLHQSPCASRIAQRTLTELFLRPLVHVQIHHCHGFTSVLGVPRGTLSIAGPARNQYVAQRTEDRPLRSEPLGVMEQTFTLLSGPTHSTTTRNVVNRR